MTIKARFSDYSINNKIAHVQLNRPPVNALSNDFVLELTGVLEQVSDAIAKYAANVVILTATGKSFCAGADLKERINTPDDETLAMVRQINNLTGAMAQLAVPTISAIHGHAIGGGFELALATDIRIASETARMGLRETALAIIPGAGGTQRLSRLIGPGNAMYWIATARLFTAQEALQFGAVNAVVADSELLTEVQKTAEMIARNGPVALRQAKKAIYGGVEMPVNKGLEYELECYGRVVGTEDRLEGLQAFKENRSPRYRGK